MSNFESSVKVIPYSQERVYNKLSDLSNLEAVKDRLPKDKVQDLSFDSDTLSFSVSPIGKLTLQIVERDPCKCIKLANCFPVGKWIIIINRLVFVMGYIQYNIFRSCVPCVSCSH